MYGAWVSGIFGNVIHGDDSGVREPPRRLGFQDEAHAELGFIVVLLSQRERFDGNDAVDFGIARLVDDAHGTASEFRQDLVPPERNDCWRNLSS